MEVYTFLVFLIALFASWLVLSGLKPRYFPPGPRGLLVIGNLRLIWKHEAKLHIVYKELSKKYGPVMGIMLGSWPTVILSNYAVIKKAFVDNEGVFSGRASMLYITRLINKGVTKESKSFPYRGLVDSEGDFWKKSRRFALTTLRELGYAKQYAEEKIVQESNILCEEIEKRAGQSIELTRGPIQLAVFNVIHTLCLGHRLDYTDPQLHHLLKSIEEVITEACYTSFVNFVPAFEFLASVGVWSPRSPQVIGRFEKFTAAIVETHRRTFDPHHHRDIIDKKISREGLPDPLKVYSDENLSMVLWDLLAAGTDTTSTTITWVLLFLLRHQDVQELCHKEIDRLLGAGQDPRLADRGRMHYVNAVIHETLRLAPVAPLALPHRTTYEAMLEGYIIPKDTLVYANLYAVHRDATYWDRPDDFRPSRWLDQKGIFQQKQEGFIPFSMGPHSCLGEALARDELFLMLTSLLQRFSFQPEDPDHPPPVEGLLGITLAPLPFKARVTVR